MFLFRPITLIVILLLVAASAARSQDAAVSAAAAPGAADPADLSRYEAAYSSDATDANAAVLAMGRGWSQLEDRDDPGTIVKLARRLGDLKVVGPALLASYLTGRIGGVPDLSASSARVAGATVGAATLCGALQSTVGRLPALGGNGTGPWRVTSGSNLSFPSSRTTIAFAAAGAIHAESRARWVPWVAYPAAATVLWVDSREQPGWMGNAASGAVLGLCVGFTLDRFERDHVRLFDRAHFMAHGSRRDFRVGFQASF